MYSKTRIALIFFSGGGGDGRLFEAGRLLTFPTYRVGWALNRINTVCANFVKITKFNSLHAALVPVCGLKKKKKTRKKHDYFVTLVDVRPFLEMAG